MATLDPHPFGVGVFFASKAYSDNLPFVAARQTWWDKIPEPFASLKGNALWSALSVAAGACISGFFTARAFDKSVVIASYVALALIGAAFIFGGLVSFLRSRADRAAVQGMRSVVVSDCVYLLKTYKRLDYENRARVRNPLHASSVPDFGQPWDLYAAELYSAKDNFSLIKLKVHGLWQVVAKTEEPAMMRLSDSAVMLDVIDALEDLLVKLREL